jgi:hypothetical protein
VAASDAPIAHRAVRITDAALGRILLEVFVGVAAVVPAS